MVIFTFDVRSGHAARKARTVTLHDTYTAAREDYHRAAEARNAAVVTLTATIHERDAVRKRTQAQIDAANEAVQLARREYDRATAECARLSAAMDQAERRAFRGARRAVIRYVITHVGKDGLRTLSLAAQGRYTYATAAEATEHMRAVFHANDRDRLASIYGAAALDTFAVCRCRCWPGHFDPVGVYFDEEDVVPS